MQKYARILSVDILSENCELQEIDYGQGQLSEHILVPNGSFFTNSAVLKIGEYSVTWHI